MRKKVKKYITENDLISDIEADKQVIFIVSVLLTVTLFIAFFVYSR